MKKHSYLLSIFILFFLSACVSQKPASKLKEISARSQDHFECWYDGIIHDFIVDLPQEPAGAPLVIMLPGWGDSAESMRIITCFSDTANPRGYAVAYITGAKSKYERSGTVSWNSGIAAKGNDDVGFLLAMAEYLQSEYGFDREHTYAVGFSNGAFMTHRLAMEAGETFAACVSVGGFMPEKIWNERRIKNNVSFFQVTGEFDDVVPKHSDGTSSHSKIPAIEDVMLYWATSNNLYALEACPIGMGSSLVKWTYADEDRPQTGRQPQVWNLVIKDGRHSWPEKRFSGIEINPLILDFFDEISGK